MKYSKIDQSKKWKFTQCEQKLLFFFLIHEIYERKKICHQFRQATAAGSGGVVRKMGPKKKIFENRPSHTHTFMYFAYFEIFRFEQIFFFIFIQVIDRQTDRQEQQQQQQQMCSTSSSSYWSEHHAQHPWILYRVVKMKISLSFFLLLLLLFHLLDSYSGRRPKDKGCICVIFGHQLLSENNGRSERKKMRNPINFNYPSDTLYVCEMEKEVATKHRWCILFLKNQVF